MKKITIAILIAAAFLFAGGVLRNVIDSNWVTFIFGGMGGCAAAWYWNRK